MSKQYYVYIATNRVNTSFYIGVTSDLINRMHQHKNELVEGFTKRYQIKKLVYFESTDEITAAIEREKQLKRWHRDWKINLIKENNPEFKDLFEEIT